MNAEALFFVMLFVTAALVLSYVIANKIAAKIDRRFEEIEEQLRCVESKAISATESIVNAVYLNSSRYKFPIPLGGPSIDSDHARLLTFFLQLKKPKKILELGSGSSTVLISRTLSDLGVLPATHIAVDHEEVFLNLTRELCAINGLVDRVSFKHCPLEDIPGHSLKWYKISKEITDLGPFDLILVDGPPAYTEHTKFSRHPALPELINQISDDGLLLLDDANRDGERYVQNSWRENFPELKFHHNESGKGVLIVSKRELF